MLLSTVCTGFAFPARPSRSPRCRAPLPLLFSCILWVRCRVCSRGSFVLRPPPSSPSRRRRRSLRFRSPLPALLGCSLVSDVASLASFLSRPLSSLRSRRIAAPDVPSFHAVCCCLFVFFLVFVLPLLRPLTVYFPHRVAWLQCCLWCCFACWVPFEALAFFALSMRHDPEVLDFMPFLTVSSSFPGLGFATVPAATRVFPSLSGSG